MVSNVGPLRTLSFGMVNSVISGDKMHIPVRADQFMFSQFKYVAGVRAQDGQGVSVDKLKILNTLIDQLVSMQQKHIQPKITARGEMSDDQISALIKQYQDQIRTVTAAAENLDYKPPMPQTGSLVNLVA